MMRKMLLRSLSMLICVVVSFGCVQQNAYSEGQVIQVYFEGEQLHFDDAQPVLKDDRTLVPFRKLFETLGFSVSWVDSGGVQKAIGTKDDLTIELTINSTTAKVNGKDAALDVPAQLVNERTMVPLRFVSENSGYEVGYSNDGSVSTIQIGAAGTRTAPAPTAPTA